MKTRVGTRKSKDRPFHSMDLNQRVGFILRNFAEDLLDPSLPGIKLEFNRRR